MDRQRRLQAVQGVGGMLRPTVDQGQTRQGSEVARLERQRAPNVGDRARVVALENVVIALLARAQVDQHDLVREMAGYLSAAGQPAEADDGRTAAEMLNLLDRSRELCSE